MSDIEVRLSAQVIGYHPEHGDLISCKAANELFEFCIEVIEKLRAENEALKSGLEMFEAIVSESVGVAGYHLNGDIATWDELDVKFKFTTDEASKVVMQ